MNTLTIIKSDVANDVSFKAAQMIVHFEDGREWAVPLKWFKKLRDASKAELENWRFIGKGEGIHWEKLDEDISVKALLK